MEQKNYRVEISCMERTIYLVEAPDSESAKRQAIDRWQAGDPSDVAGFGWRELESANVAAVFDPVESAQDDVVMLRFIRERERLQFRFGPSVQEGTMSDAISAGQAALELGWVRSSPDGGLPDAVRAAESLERLYGRKLLVSFDRECVRTGERGEIRLYCTPEYLESLKASVDDRGASPAVASRESI